MKKTAASAPTKLILCGEHYVVYGARALAFATALRNRVELLEAEGEPCIEIRSRMGNAVVYESGKFIGAEILRGFGELFLQILRKNGFRLRKTLRAKLLLSAAPKGMGNSASLGAALALTLYSHFGKKQPRFNDIFEAVQASEKIMHGGIPSGVDALSVIKGGFQVFRKKFDPAKVLFKDARVEFPRGVRVVVIDTCVGGMKSTTNEMVKKFARRNLARGRPEEIGETERKRITRPYDKLFAGIFCRLCWNGDARALGKLLNENHELLARSGMSSRGIERARKICLKNGAFGAKLSGAGGEGGAVISLVDAKKVNTVLRALKKEGFRAFAAEVDFEGAKLV
ncbi:MAG: hypothetical protein AB1468_00590 [Candidatus Micrarchaeota archaeon]